MPESFVATDPPPSWDWRTKGVVPPVHRNHGMYNNPYIFAAASAVDSAMSIATGKLVEYSFQQIHDCCNANSGCKGDDVWKYIKANPLETADDYVYQHGTCGYDRD